MMVQNIVALNTCHADYPVAKFWGHCNQQKWDLDRCLREEKVLKRCTFFASSYQSSTPSCHTGGVLR